MVHLHDNRSTCFQYSMCVTHNVPLEHGKETHIRKVPFFPCVSAPVGGPGAAWVLVGNRNSYRWASHLKPTWVGQTTTTFRLAALSKVITDQPRDGWRVSRGASAHMIMNPRKFAFLAVDWRHRKAPLRGGGFTKNS